MGHSSNVWSIAPAFSQFFVSTGSFYLTSWALVLTMPVASDYKINVSREFIYLMSPLYRINPFSLYSCTLENSIASCLQIIFEHLAGVHGFS